MRIVIEVDEQPGDPRRQDAPAQAGPQTAASVGRDAATVTGIGGGIDGGAAPTSMPLATAAIASQATAVLPLSPPPGEPVATAVATPGRSGAEGHADENAGPAPGTQVEGPVVEIEEEEG